MVRTHRLALLPILESVVVTVTASIGKVLTGLGLWVVAVAVVGAFTGAGHHGQQAGIFAHRLDTHFFTSGFVLEIVAIANAFAAKPKPKQCIFEFMVLQIQYTQPK